MTQLFLSLLWAAVLLVSPVLVPADQATYIYDDLGRLSQVIDGTGNVATYNYDAVGNLLSIARNTGGVGAPTITGLTPNSGSAGSTVTVTLTGTNLTGASLATDNPGMLVRNVVTTPTSISASFVIAFSARPGATAVMVTTSTGSATASFSVNASAPVLSALSPTSGPVTRLVTITGNGFSSTAGLNQIRFNGVTATTLSATATSLTAQVPAGATTGPVTVTVGSLTSNGLTFTVANAGPPPTLTAVAPNIGSVQGGQQTTLTGTNFVAGTTVKIANKPAAVLTLLSATSMIVQMPASVPGPADVVVTNTNGDALLQNGYTYLSGAPQKIGTITPTMGLINIPRNVPVTVSFSRPVDRASITTATVAFTQGVTPVAGTFSFDFGDTVVTFRPTAQLAATTAYTLSLTQGIKSVDGVPLDGPFIGSFTTGTNSDTVSPMVTISPANGATNVPFNTSIVLTFSEPVNPNTVNAATVLVVSQGEARAGTITFGQQNTFAIFTPASPFFPTAAATVTVLGLVTDQAGNALQGAGGIGTSVAATFTTGNVADRFPPVVLQVLPANGATGASVRTSISATFSESINPASITPTTFQVSSGGVPIPGSFVLTNLNQGVTFIPNNPFPPVSTVTLSISNVADVVGNVMVLPFTSSFQTQSAIDNVRPSVLRPSPGSFIFQASPPTNTNVPLNFKPMIAFDERVNPSTVNSTTFTLSQTNVGTIPSIITMAPDGLSALLTPTQQLLPNTIYSVGFTSGIQDLVGNQLFNPGSVGFTTGPVAIDSTLPVVVEASPATGTLNLPVNATVTVLFSEPVSFTSITQQTVVLSSGGVPVNTQFTLERNNTVLRIKPANLLTLQASKFYELTVTPGVLDLAGNPLGAIYSSSFTTGSATDTTGPTVTTFNPAHLATGVNRQTAIAVTFSEPINPISLTSTAFNMGGAAGTLAVSPDRRTVTFTPTFPFFANSSISLSTTGVEDLTGNTGSGSAFFTTALAPGTITANLPTTAAGTANPDTLFSDGITTTTITMNNISSGSSLTLVPNGTTVGVMTIDPSAAVTGGGAILNGLQSPADPRVRLFTTFGGSITFTYRSPNEPLPKNSGSGIRLVSVDAAGAPVTQIATVSVSLVRSSTFLPARNPSALLANGTSTGEMSLIVRDARGNPVPAGEQVAVTFEPVFPPTNSTSVGGGIINGGTAAPDPRFKLFTTLSGGLITFTYTAPIQAGNQNTSAALQMAEIDSNGQIVKQVTTFDGLADRFTLNGTTGFTGPQPAVLAVSPAHTQSGVGTNATVDVLFSQSLDPATVSASTFSVTSGSAVPGGYSFLATDRGPNTLVRFTPTVPFAPSGTFTVAITVGIKNTAGIPLLSPSAVTFSTGTVPDTIPPSVTDVMPPGGSADVATNRLLTVQFSEPINATTVSATTVTVSNSGTPVSGRLSLGTGPNGPNTVATFLPNQLLSATTGYDVALSPAILDTAGNPLVSFGSSFTSGTGVDNFKPSVVSSSPLFHERFSVPKNIPLNTKIVVIFSEPMNPLTLTTNSVQVTFTSDASTASVPVSGALEISADLRTVTFAPAQPLAPASTYSVTLGSGITDLAGNTLLPVLGTSFVTGVQAAESTPLTVTMSPAGGDTNIALNAPVTFQFSRSVAPTTLTASTVTVTGSGGPIPGTVTFEQENRLVRWKPANLIQFAPNTLHTVSISTGVTDLAGVPMAAGVSSSFTTGAGTDTTLPTLVSSNPSNNSTGLARTTTVSVTMSEPINPATLVIPSSVSLSGPGAQSVGFNSSVPGTVTVSPDRRTITFAASQPFLANQFYSLNVGGVEDLAGNKVANNTLTSFTTGFAAGTTLSSLPSTATVLANPSTLFADGLQSTTIIVSGVGLPSGTLVPNGTTVAVTADPAISGTSAGGVILGGTPSPTDSRFKLFTTFGGGFSFTYISPNRPDLTSAGTGIIQIASVDVAGTPVSRAGTPLIASGTVSLVRGNLLTSFFNPGNSSAAALRANGTSTADVTLTLLRGSSPAPAGSRLAVTVDSVFLPSAGGTINGGLPASDPRFKIFTTLPDGTVEFTYTSPLLLSGTGTGVFQAAVADTSGTILGPIQFQGLLSLSATTGSLSPLPVVVALSPAGTQNSVGTNARIMAKFSQPLDPTTVSSSSFTVTSGFTTISGTRTVSASERGPNTVVTFAPSAPLPANSSVNVAITSGMKNSVGEPLLLTTLSSATFSTGPGPDTAAPSITQVNPPDGVLSAGTNNVITAEFSEPINATTVSTSTFIVSAGGVPVNGRVKVITGPRGLNTQAVFTPDQLLGSTVTYAVAIGTGITDAAGNPLTAPFNSAFGTGNGIDNFQPSLVSVSPQNGAKGVALNVRVTARFSEPVNPLTIHAGTFGVSGLTGTIAVASDLLSATWTPTQPLLPNTAYSVLVQTNGTDAIRDLAGNVMLTPGFSAGLGGFTTGSGPIDTTGPQVLVVSPADTTASMPINGQVVVQFSEPLAAPSVHGQTVTVAAGGVPIPGTITLEQANTVVRWKLPVLTQFAANTLYTVTVTTGVTDLVGNPLNSTFTSTFTTSTGADTAAPTVTSVTPATGLTNVSRATQVTVTLNEAINPATVVLADAFSGGTFNLTSGAISGMVQGTVVVSPDRKTLTFTPAFPLLANQLFTVSLSQVEDPAGNKITSSSSFRTEFAPATNLTALPTTAVVSSSPTQLFADGLTSSTVTVTNIVRSGILVPNGTVVGVTADRVFHNFITGSSDGGTIIGGVPSSQDSRIRLFTTLNGSITFTYQSPNRPDLFTNGIGMIQVSSVDAAGAPIGLLGSTNVTLVRGSSATVDFNPISLLANGTSFSEVSISLTDGAVSVPSGAIYAVTTEPVFLTSSFPGTVNGGTVAPDNRFKLFTTVPGGVINFTYTAPVLASGQTKSSFLQLAKVDGSGNILSPLGLTALGGYQIQLNGSTGSLAPQPMVLAVSPANGQVSVGTTVSISAKFSLPIDRATVSSGPSGTFTVTQGTTPIPGTFAFASSDRGTDTIVTFVPGTPFSIDASIAVNITVGIRSVSGEPLRASSSATFSTALAPDTLPPTVAQANPADGSGAAPTNSVVSVEFSEPINATTIEATNFSITTGGVPVVGRYTFAEGGHGKNSIVTFIPNQLLLPNTTYLLSVTSGVKDSAGNSAVPATVTFTTAGGIDNVVPMVLSTTPTSGATDFPATGLPVTVTFSEPVNPLTINPNTVNFGGTIRNFTIGLSQNNTVLTVTPLVPLFAATSYTLQLLGVQDVAGNPLASTSVSFRTLQAAGTTNLPTAATVTFNPPGVFANGQISSQATISVTRNSVPVPNGTRVAVSADPSLSASSLGGTITGPNALPSIDSRFVTFPTLGGQIVVNYAPPDLVGLGFTSVVSASIQVYAIDLDTRPVFSGSAGGLGTGIIQLAGPSTAIGSANPTTTNQAGSSTITFSQITDGRNTLVPDGTRIGVRVGTLVNADRFFETGGGGGGGSGGLAVDTSAAWQGSGVLVPAGSISGGTASGADPNIRLFTTTGGQLTATYQAGNAALTGNVVIQAVAVDAAGVPVRVLGTANVTLTFVGLGP
ncbi:MAG: Ig-like domain-containing protein [Nitrospira sp.]